MQWAARQKHSGAAGGGGTWGTLGGAFIHIFLNIFFRRGQRSLANGLARRMRSSKNKCSRQICPCCRGQVMNFENFYVIIIQFQGGFCNIVVDKIL